MSTFTTFFSNPTPTTEIYTLSLHDALPICFSQVSAGLLKQFPIPAPTNATAVINNYNPTTISLNLQTDVSVNIDRKSTRLNSSHSSISYAVFCLKKKKQTKKTTKRTHISVT